MAGEPTVLCVCLTADRHGMTERAIRCFHSQSYENKAMFILDTGVEEFRYFQAHGIYGEYYPGWRIDQKRLGELRNDANEFAHPKCLNADIICHFDSDDYSHPNRIAEQVAFLQSSGAAVVGYNQMLFWNTWGQRIEIPDPEDVTKTMSVNSFDNRGLAEAWLFTNPAHQPLGTSLCYWRSTWESHRFDDRKHAGEDSDFLARVGHRRVKSVSSLADGLCHAGVDSVPREPRMIATVHGANTQQKTYDGFFKGGTVEMKRVAQWDERVRQVLEGA